MLLPSEQGGQYGPAHVSLTQVESKKCHADAYSLSCAVAGVQVKVLSTLTALNKHSRNTVLAAAAHAMQLSPHPVNVQLDVAIAGSALEG